ncbi:MAG TPA: AraC family transcriptional regulator, partial [Solimonas sp.]|nr:AraC family transcriptional regulator [Solimonas sp.]
AAVALFGEMVDAVCDPTRPPLQREPRILRAMQMIEALPLDQLSHDELSRELQLSASRTRALFQRQLGCTMSQYMRWVAAWKAAAMWRQGRSFTEIALAAGFYDLAHADRVMNEMFGMNPSFATDPRICRLHFRR